LKDGSSADESGSSQGQTWPRNETSANEEVKPDAEKDLGKVAEELSRTQRRRQRLGQDIPKILACVKWAGTRPILFGPT
jgi:hypothetical protein